MSVEEASPGALTAPVTHPPMDALPPQQPVEPDRQGTASLIMCLVAFIFAAQDGVSRYLGANYSPMFVVMVRYWFFAIFVTAMVARSPGGLRGALRSKRPVLQIARGVLLVLEVVIIIESFLRLGLINTHALFACGPLLVVALSGPILGEKIGWRRWSAVGAGFIGILIILRPDGGLFVPDALLGFSAAIMFAVYLVLTRLVSRSDSATVSFFWTGIGGAVTATLLGWRYIQPVALPDLPWLALLCCTGALSHYLLIRAYEMAEASSLQPFAYTQLLWVSAIGTLVFGEMLTSNVVIGTIIVVGAGLFTWWRQRQRARLPVK